MTRKAASLDLWAICIFTMPTAFRQKKNSSHLFDFFNKKRPGYIRVDLIEHTNDKTNK